MKTFLNTMYLELFLNYKKVLPYNLAILGLYILLCMLNVISGTHMNFASFIWDAALLGSIPIVAKIFSNEQNPIKSVFFMTLPISLNTRFFSKLILTLFVFPLSFILCMIIIGNIFELLRFFIEYDKFLFVIPTNSAILDFKLYILFHSLFFAGSVFFKRNPLGKTILYASCYIICLTLLAVFIFKENIFFFTNVNTMPFSVILTCIKVGIPLFLYVSSYFALQELEVR